MSDAFADLEIPAFYGAQVGAYVKSRLLHACRRDAEMQGKEIVSVRTATAAVAPDGCAEWGIVAVLRSSDGATSERFHLSRRRARQHV